MVSLTKPDPIGMLCTAKKDLQKDSDLAHNPLDKRRYIVYNKNITKTKNTTKENIMISLNNLPETTNTLIDNKGKGRRLVVTFEKVNGFGITTRSFSDIETAEAFLAGCDLAVNPVWDATSACWSTYREPTVAEIDSFGTCE